jgi:hypothetical protein
MTLAALELTETSVHEPVHDQHSERPDVNYEALPCAARDPFGTLPACLPRTVDAAPNGLIGVK